MKMGNTILTLVSAATISLGLTCSSVQAAPPTTSPYFTDVQSSYNKDTSAEAFMIVSIVSCYVRAMAPEKAINVVGSTPYVALIDVNLCESNSQTTSGSGSVVQTKKYETALVIASVTNGVLDGKIWLKGSDTNDTTKTWVSIKITGGPAKIPPFGEWEVNWCDGFNEVTKECVSFGHAKVDPSGSRSYSYDFDGNIQEERAVVGSIAADMRSGGGKYLKSTKWLDQSSGPTDVAGYYSFDTTRQYQSQIRNQNNSERCMIPRSDEPGAKISSWETWLYDELTGQRFDVNSGFSIKDESNKWGYAGEWGVSIGNSVPEKNKKVFRVDSAGNVQATYRVTTSPGRLHRIENQSSSLAEISGLTLRGGGPKSLVVPNSISNEWVSFAWYWKPSPNPGNPNLGRFVITDYLACINDICSTEYLNNVEYSIEDLVALNQDHLYAYQEGTNNNISIVLSEWRETNQQQWNKVIYSNPNDVVVRTRRETPVIPGDTTIPTILKCVGTCATLLNNQLSRETNHGSVGSSSVYTYSWDSSAGALKIGEQFVDFTANNESNFYSGVLVTDAQLSDLACQHYDQSSQSTGPGYCQWDADRKLTTYYRWISGPDSWSRFTGLLSENGEIVRFEPPITVSYEVPTTDSSSYKGKTVSIQYAGSGNLWIPGYCYSETSGKRSNCGDGTDWANEFNIPFDTQTGYVSTTNGKRYLVKTLKRGVAYPDASDPSTCNSLKASATSYNAKTLPTKADWKNPADPSSSNFIGAWRESTAPPLVIDGELQR